MTFIKKLKSKFKLLLRRNGFLCKKPIQTNRRYRISKTVWSDGTETYYDEPLRTKPFNKNSFESELHVWKEIHKDNFKNK